MTHAGVGASASTTNESPASAPTLSVVIPTHNRSALLAEALASVFAQEPSGLAVEVIVVDDRSTDATADVVARFPGAIYLRSDAGRSGAARNVGLARATGRWLAFLDDDDVWRPQKLARLAAAIAADATPRVILSAAETCDEALRPQAIWRGPRGDGAGGMYHGFMDSIVTASVVVLHRDVLASVGGFDESLRRAEDRDFYLRIARAGFRFEELPEALVLYRDRPRLDADELVVGFRESLGVLRRAFVHEHPQRPSFWRRQRSELLLRRYYAKSLLTAARQRANDGRPREAARMSALAFGVSPLHWVYHRVVRRGRRLGAA